jgi:GTP-binding protein HflX
MHSQYGLGSGKVEEIKEFIIHNKADQIIVDERMTPKQIYNLENATGVKVMDRERLILNIFRERVTTSEAKLQIQLAEIKYELPRIRESAKILTGDERPGKGGSGEYIVDVKFRDLKRRMGFVLQKLAQARTKRQLYHDQRSKNKIPTVSLVGYTSSGKTTLFNLLTLENRETSDKLFTTLSTTTRSFNLSNRKALLIDTVGFISRLPTYMIEAFKSTLEESLMANIILLLIDSSQSAREIKMKCTSCLQILNELKVQKEKVFIILTKCDKFDSKQSTHMQEIAESLGLQNPINISAKTGHGIHKLKILVERRI